MGGMGCMGDWTGGKGDAGGDGGDKGLYVGRVKKTDPMKGYTIIDCPDTGSSKDTFMHAAVLSPEAVEEEQWLAFGVHWNPKGDPQVTQPVYVLAGSNMNSVSGGTFQGVVSGVDTDGSGIASCPGCTAMYGGDAVITSDLMEACQLQQGDKLAYDVNMTPFGLQVSDPIWKQIVAAKSGPKKTGSSMSSGKGMGGFAGWGPCPEEWGSGASGSSVSNLGVPAAFNKNKDAKGTMKVELGQKLGEWAQARAGLQKKEQPNAPQPTVTVRRPDGKQPGMWVSPNKPQQQSSAPKQPGMWVQKQPAKKAEEDEWGQRMMAIEVPEGVTAGMTLEAQAPDGTMLSVEVPPDTPPGSTITVAY